MTKLLEVVAAGKVEQFDRLYMRGVKAFYRAIVRGTNLELWYNGSGKDISILVSDTPDNALLIAKQLARVVDVLEVTV